MDGFSIVESRRSVGRKPTGLICLLGGALMCVSLASPAMAQLRSGRIQRSLYQHELQPEAEQAAYDDAVTTAAYESGEVVSIMDDHVVPASCAGCSDGCQSCDAGLPLQGCGAAGCTAMGCDACAGGYSEIAPTCTAACPPGCGPLQALWYRLKVRAEVPIYWRRDQGPPSLVTSSDVGTSADLAGQLGESTTNILLGNGALTDEGTAGFRLTLGTWIGGSDRFGLMFRYWTAGDLDTTHRFDSNSFPILARPFFNTTVSGSEEQDTQLISFPGESVGNIQVDTSSMVDGLEITLRRLLYKDRFTRVDWLYGYQHVGIEERLMIASSTTVTANTPLQGTNIAVSDRFQTENDFNGFSYGIMSSRRFACWKMETMFRLGMGNLRRKVNIAGSTTTSSGGTSSVANQGLLARNTNSQPLVDDTFVVVPEVGINFAYRLRPGMDFNVGYNYLLIPKVAQAARQLDNDLAVNLSDPLVGALDPQLDFEERRYWLHSLGLGVQFRY